MSMILKLYAVLTILLPIVGSGLILSTPAAARTGVDGAAMLLAAGEKISLNQAAAQVQQRTKGRILSAETISRDGKAVHRIKVLMPNGNVKIVHVDAD